jgi:RNase P/RNase MRP subunit POP5
MTDRNDQERAFYKELSRTIGELDYNRINPRIIKYLGPKWFIIRVDNEGLQRAILALSLMRRLDTTEMGFYTLLSSGTIKALEKGFGNMPAGD